uniref:Sigma-70 family RNA polymerase sigma factor n=1 Tax=Schlesneria paludicola TaxID=360056 RepID=A0A7C4QWZ1_9PLAN
MSGDAARREAELVAAFSAHQSALRHWLVQAFGRLRDEVDDILQDALAEVLHRVRTEAFSPQMGWVGYLRVVARHRAIDRLRDWERRLFRGLGSGEAWRTDDLTRDSPHVTDPRPGPAEQAVEAERRGRQGLLLSEVLEEFCRWCESRPQRLPMKEAYERSLRGEQPAQIAAGMGLPAHEVYTLLNQARTWVVQRIRQADVDRSVFLTLHRRKGE